MIDALVGGRLYAKPEERTSRNGNAFVTAKLLVSIGEERVFCNVIAFDQAACAALLALGEGESASIAGELRPKVYEATDGTTRLSLDCTARAIDGYVAIPPHGYNDFNDAAVADRDVAP